ncbi:MAG: hypothetical protein DRN81_02095 [Thermoproteota archaeon]|nr:MAG: hypothetical protein DRN81_02095 [Candidatus Korarchaeota archaeon]
MLFRIDGNVDEIYPAVEEFCKSIEDDWKPAMVEARKKLEKIPMPIKFDVPLMDEIVIPCWKEDDHVLMRIPVMSPGGSIGNKILGRAARKKMEKNLKGYFKGKDINVKIKKIGE